MHPTLEALNDGERDPYDTHPALPERLAALARLPAMAPGVAPDPRPAVSLLEGTDSLERELLLSVAADPSKVAALVAIDWHQVGERIYPTAWAESVKPTRAHLKGMTPGSLPADPAFYQDLARRVLGTDADGAPPESLARFGASQIAAAVALELKGAGWAIEALPGETVVFTRGDARWEPFTRLAEVAAGKLTIAEWQRDCAAAGISAADLGAVPAGTAVSAGA